MILMKNHEISAIIGFFDQKSDKNSKTYQKRYVYTAKKQQNIAKKLCFKSNFGGNQLCNLVLRSEKSSEYCAHVYYAVY